MTTILVCGSRDPIGDWTTPVRQWLHWVADGLKRRGTWLGGAGATILHGGCRGIDYLADSEARTIGYKVVRYDADWDKFGNAAGPIRNRRMFEDGKPTLGLAFGSLVKSKGNGGVKLTGTGDMVSVMNAGGCPVILIPTPNVLPETW